MTSNELNDQELDTLFASARQAVPDVDAAFLERLQDSAEHALAPRAEIPPGTGSTGAGYWAAIKAAIGGWGGVGGLVTATVAGFWIGISPPDALSSSADVLTLLDIGADATFDSWFALSDVDLLLGEDL